MLAFHSSISGTVKPKAFSKFQAAPEVATAQILATIIGGVIKLPIAKTLNLWGRAEGYIFFVVVYTIGMIILACSDDTASYSAGYVLYWIGYDAIYLILDVFVADTSGLRNRAFAFAFAGTPFICTAFTGPRAAESFLRTSGWAWAYGAFCIIMPVVFAPLVVIFKLFERKAKKKGLYKKVPSGRTVPQSIVHYFHEFDSKWMMSDASVPS
jgi:MFS family permease